MKALRILFLLLLLSSLSFAQESQTFLALKSTGVEDFIKQHPEYDGRGTIIIVLDTGVDMGIDGLVKTSTGQVKVIDVQDFTGEGDMQFYPADKRTDDGKTILENLDKKFSVKADLEKLIPSADKNYFIGAFPEKHLINSNSGSADLNGNGSTDDVYYFIAYKTTDEYWVVYFDLNGNGDVSDERPIRNYKENFDAFSVERAKGLAPFTMALNIFPEENKVVFFFDDGSHGTHCAGIAAGFNIGEVGLNGVAPGANIIALKIGHNNFPGGATVNESMKKAYVYADKISRERKEPCIVSMSYGIGSEIEDHSEMENFLAKLLKENPYLYVSVSNGNEGPGISSSGLPASSNYVFSSGAVLAKEVARDNYGNELPNDVILHFSSRGGEVSKPDVVSPGAATSTVPNFTPGDKFWGTSMACPYSAGVMSLILSAAQKEFSDIKIPSQLLYKIIRESATYWNQYTVLDQGGGFINVINAYDLMRKFLKNGEHKKFETYSINSFAPNQADNKANNLYIRDGSFLTGDEVFSFNIKRENSINSDKFYRTYNLKTDADWLKLIQKKIYIRNDQQAVVNVKLDKTKLKLPGLYTAKIVAVRDDASSFPEFDMLATVVIPYEFNSSNNYKMIWKGETVQQGMIKRYFVKLPAGQNSMKIVLSRDKMSKKYARCRYFLHNNDGIQVDVSKVLYSVNNDEKVENVYYDLTPGIYEIIVDGFFLASEPSVYNLEVEFRSISRLSSEPLTSDNSSIEVVNYFNEARTYNLSGEIFGLRKNYYVKVDGNGTQKILFTLRKGERSKEFSFTLTKEDFNRVTDFSFQISDSTGKALSKNALSYRNGGSVSVDLPEGKDSANFTLELIPAFVNKELEAKVLVEELTYLPSPLKIDVKSAGQNSVTLYPNNIKTLDVKFVKPEMKNSEDGFGFGKIYFKSSSNNNTEYELPINFKY
ncbi:Subtilisin-like serine protease [Ignavibacterium album JCM 16511]|uniref:Subtilisin-like serine protease n=1 Tax=Ignavibacterium album (strain DSM 19864 / JCM 16511 / NBRC 101810 / Mat9-16) TaxID=945713 RepID=I0APG1_IGNAJ|nr:S8 family serine peptidase [Ignavibacterium album]AFH50868.1 Subtilisin-like serine protease [Ignavibacterium album JCM 16511]